MSVLKSSKHLRAHGVTALWLGVNDWVPNNPRLPVLHYEQAIVAKAASADAFERLFTQNGWPPQWRNGIYPFHHFHSTAHEVLGIAMGEADLILGGPNGERVPVRAGACIVLPAGVGHCLAAGSHDLLVVGGYPPGQAWDLQKGAISDAQQRAMYALPLPASDPVNDKAGVLPLLWGRA